MTTDDYTKVDASPTKEFFVEMLTKDVSMAMAILDLVDNSVDGARKTTREDSLGGHSIRITFDKHKFTIEDNCGGIPLEVAMNYAFRFGRSAKAPTIEHSVGRFGVGMKRALFKIGRHFNVTTKTTQEQYRVAADVNDWLEQEDWEFRVTNVGSSDEDAVSSATGTVIIVENLTREAENWFGISYNVSNLIKEISRRHQYYIDNGISIFVNGVAIPTTHIGFLVSEYPRLCPAYREYDRDGVHVRVLAGVGQSYPPDAGWYVYCNGRMVLDADRTRTTGWGEPKMMPRFHNQYARFRGVAFFDSADSTLLPWNTTKDGVDEGVPVFLEAYRTMVSLMRPVIRFLDLVARETEKPEGHRPLVELLESRAALLPIAKLGRSEEFRYEEPPPPIAPSERLVAIQYQRPAGLIDLVKKQSGVRTARAAGELTFDYFVDQEGLDVS